VHWRSRCCPQRDRRRDSENSRNNKVTKWRILATRLQRLHPLAKSGEEQEPEPDLDEDVRRIVDSGQLPSPQVRAQSPHDDSMMGGARADGSQASETDTEPVATMSGWETLSALQVDLAAVIDDDIVSDIGRDVDPNDEASSFGGRSASNLSRALVGQTQPGPNSRTPTH
jgi:hypothetical protein